MLWCRETSNQSLSWYGLAVHRKHLKYYKQLSASCVLTFWWVASSSFWTSNSLLAIFTRRVISFSSSASSTRLFCSVSMATSACFIPTYIVIWYQHISIIMHKYPHLQIITHTQSITHLHHSHPHTLTPSCTTHCLDQLLMHIQFPILCNSAILFLFNSSINLGSKVSQE